VTNLKTKLHDSRHRKLYPILAHKTRVLLFLSWLIHPWSIQLQSQIKAGLIRCGSGIYCQVAPYYSFERHRSSSFWENPSCHVHKIKHCSL